ncbi:MAG TPA: hypothetical protein VJ915_11225 [Balneolaceae bacterium]|nr:hypothetical protein [Balneolaceae bacterium]
MKLILFVRPASIVSLLMAASLIFWGCGDSDENGSSSMNMNETASPALLQIQPADSLLFSPSGTIDSSFVWPADLNDSLVTAFSFIRPSESTDAIKTFTPGTLIHISLDDNLTISVEVKRNQAIGDETRSITGTIQAPHSGSFTLSVRPDMLGGTINVLSENRLFYIRYDQESGRHYLAEINRNMLDVQEGSEPLEYN